MVGSLLIHNGFMVDLKCTPIFNGNLCLKPIWLCGRILDKGFPDGELSRSSGWKAFHGHWQMDRALFYFQFLFHFMIMNKYNDPLERDLYKQSYSARRRIIRTIISNEIFLNEICVNKREWHFVWIMSFWVIICVNLIMKKRIFRCWYRGSRLRKAVLFGMILLWF